MNSFIHSRCFGKCHGVTFTSELCEQVKSINLFRADRAITNKKRYKEGQSKIQSHQRPKLAAIKHGKQENRAVWNNEHQTYENGKASYFHKVKNLGGRNPFFAIFSGYSMRGNHRDRAFLIFYICTTSCVAQTICLQNALLFAKRSNFIRK